jgi:Ca-activated chloride channel family protein
MVIEPAILALTAALLAGGLAALGEALHARRIARIAPLAFGPDAGRPPIAAFVSWGRPIAAALAAWGLVHLATLSPQEADATPSREASNHMLLLLDVSPSMQVADAGPDMPRVTRAVWAGRVVQAILDRLDMDRTRISIVSVYSEALPIVQETFDKEVVRNILDGLPMQAAFRPGSTDIQAGLDTAFELAKPWPRDSALFVVVSDGDATPVAPGRMPASIAQSIVIGLGDPVVTTMVAGRSSRQDAASLRALATRLGGLYHDGNRKHLPSSVLDALELVSPRAADAWSLRDLALAAVGFGGFFLALSGPFLMLFARRRRPSPSDRPSTIVGATP